MKDGGEFLIVNEGAYREDKNIKKWADMLNFEVYSPEYLTNILTSTGFACEYHLDNKSHLAFIAKKIL